MWRRYYRVPPMWRELDRMQREMNRLFEAYSPERFHRAPGYPALNVWRNDEGLIVTAEVPGVRPEDIDISVIGQTLTLSGERRPDHPSDGVRYHRQERFFGKFTRSLELPFPVNVDKVEATFEHGVLSISLPRAEEDKPKKITVKSAA